MSRPQTFFEPNSDPKNSPLGPQKVKIYPKISQNQMLELKKMEKIDE